MKTLFLTLNFRIITKKMKRTLAYVLTAFGALIAFGFLVHGVLVAADAAQPARNLVYGPTPKRVWAVIFILVSLIGVLTGGFSHGRHRLATPKGKIMAIAAMTAGLLGVVSGTVNLASATGGPGTGNGVVGSAMAIVLGAVSILLGGVALIRAARIGKGGKI